MLARELVAEGRANSLVIAPQRKGTSYRALVTFKANSKLEGAASGG